VCFKFILAKGSRKKPPVVFSAIQINDKGALEFSLGENHDGSLTACLKRKNLSTNDSLNALFLAAALTLTI
jgi:hypothetical protein